MAARGYRASRSAWFVAAVLGAMWTTQFLRGANDSQYAAVSLTGVTTPTVGGARLGERSGEAQYSYAFDLPPGRDGMTPALALTYSSDRGNSWVGRGFQLTSSAI